MRKLLVSAAFALVLAVAPAMAQTADTTGSPACQALDARIGAASENVSAFFAGLITAEYVAAVNSAMQNIQVEAIAAGVTDISQLPADAVEVIASQYQLRQALQQLEPQVERLVNARIRLGSACTDPHLLLEVEVALSNLTNEAYRQQLRALAERALYAAKAYNTARIG